MLYETLIKSDAYAFSRFLNKAIKFSPEVREKLFSIGIRDHVSPPQLIGRTKDSFTKSGELTPTGIQKITEFAEKHGFEVKKMTFQDVLSLLEKRANSMIGQTPKVELVKTKHYVLFPSITPETKLPEIACKNNGNSKRIEKEVARLKGIVTDLDQFNIIG